jgi:hypothetical protein
MVDLVAGFDEQREGCIDTDNSLGTGMDESISKVITRCDDLHGLVGCTPVLWVFTRQTID